MRDKKKLTTPHTERLITAATSLFYRRGYGAVSVEDIVEAGHVTKPTLYRQFHSKDNLAAACLLRQTAVERETWRSVADAAASPRAQLEALIAAYASRIAAPDFRGSPFVNAASELTEVDNPTRRVAEQFEREARTHVLGLCEQAGSHRPQVLADGLLLLLHGAAASRHFSSEDGPMVALLETASSLMEAYLPPAA